MPRTGAQLLTALGVFLADAQTGTTTSAGATDGTTLVDTSLRRYGDDAIRGWYLRPTGASNTLAVRRITGFAAATGTCTVAPAFAAQAATSEAYGLHRYDPAAKFRALDAARFQAFPEVCEIIYDDSLTSDGRNRHYDTPSTMRSGPTFAFIENPLPADPSWNFLLNPRGDSLTGWTRTGATATIVGEPLNDLVVPKYDSTCMRVAVAANTNGTVDQVIGDMINGIAVAEAAGRQMTFAVWVHCRIASRVSVQIRDDTGSIGTATPATHNGGGWELLTVTANVAATNATTLTARINVSSTAAALTYFWNRAWFYYGPGHLVRDIFDSRMPLRVRRDDTTQRLWLDTQPNRGYQIRLVGRDIVTALGTVVADQDTNSMEVDVATEEILVAQAASLLMEWEGMTADDQGEVSARLRSVERRRADLARKWPFDLPATPTVKNPWSKR